MLTEPLAEHLRVLYVEDDPVLRDLFSQKLTRLGAVRSVVTCGSPRDAVNAANDGHYDVALLDLNLGAGQINGIDLGLALRAILPGVPIVIFSQYAVPRVENVVPARERDNWCFVQKTGRLEIAEIGEVIQRASIRDGQSQARRPGGNDERTSLERLTRRQRQVMALAAAGYDAKGIAERLHLAHVSVRRELSLAYRVLVPDPEPGTDLRTVAVLEYMRQSGAFGQPPARA
jgi:DNA-binding NarL/FixJ family response regulator